jgi:hypothetical protein
MPDLIKVNMAHQPPTEDWKERMLAAEVDGLRVSWGGDCNIGRNAGAIAAGFPEVPLDPEKVLEFVAPLPFELCVPSGIEHWDDDYFPPAIGADHALLGWGCVLKGAGHENSMVSRRWVEHGPWRVFHGAEDTTFMQFHELGIERAASMPQAQASHDWMVAGFLRPTHRYAQDVRGVYTADDGLLRVVVNDRQMSDRELLDACAARRDGRADPDKPIRNVAYVFVDEQAARERLDALWLRGLECRALIKGDEVRLDEDHSIERATGWW